MFKSISVPVALAAALLAAPAYAQDDAAEDGFNGFYVGAAVGFDFQPNDNPSGIAFDNNLDGVFGDTVRNTAGANVFVDFCSQAAIGPVRSQGCSKDEDDIGYSGRVGFDYQLGDSFLGGGAVIGVVGEFGKNEIRDSVSAFTSTPAFYTMNRKIRYNGALRLRAGYTPNNTTLFYLTGGGAYAKVSNRFRTSNTINSVTTNGSQDAYGYSVGGGVEQKITRNISVGVEYIFTEVDEDESVVRLGRGTAPATQPFVLVNANGTDFIRTDPKFRWNSIRGVVNLRF